MRNSPILSSAQAAAMTRLPPSPEAVAVSSTRNPPELSLDGTTILRSNSPSSLQQQQHPRRLKSVAKYGSFHPQALACSTEIINTSYNDLESSQDYGGPSSLGAIAGPRGVALFRVSRPHVPLVIFSHATNSSKGNSISALAFQPYVKKLSGAARSDISSLYLAAARGSGVLIWDASGHNANPLLGRLLMDPVQDSAAASSSVSSISWKANPASAGGSEPLLATTVGASLSLWDLRSSTTVFKPSLRYTSTARNHTNVPLVQVACSSVSDECATIDTSGVVRIYDIRMSGRASFNASPVGTFVAHEAGVGILHLPLENDPVTADDNGTSNRSAWVTWGLEDPATSAVVKVWSPVDTTSSSGPKDSIDRNANHDDYWYMTDDNTTVPSPNITKATLPMSSTEYRLIAQCSRANIACARVCVDPVKNSIVVVGYSGVTGAASNQGWYAELLSINSEPALEPTALSDQLTFNDAKKNFGMSKIVGFQGGSSNSNVDKKPLMSMLGNLSLGRLQAAELAFSTRVHSASKVNDKATGNDVSKESNMVGDVELLLCCLSDSGVITTSALPEALPKRDTSRNADIQKGPVSPTKKVRSDIVRAALSNNAVPTRVFPDNSEGDSLFDVASVFRSSAGVEASGALVGPDLEARFEKRSISAPKTQGNDESYREVSRRTDTGGFMPFDMDVPVQPAYGTVNTGNVGGLHIGMSDIAPNPMINVSVDDTRDFKGRDATAMMENIETDRIPCPRLCGATFGIGNGALVIFHNGEVKKMWNWFQKMDMIRLSSVPGGPVDAATASDPKMLNSKTAEADEKTQILPSFGPRSLKELTDMMTTAKEAQWGEVADVSATPDDAMSVLEKFFEDESLDSNSDDSGDDDDDNDEEDTLEQPSDDNDEIYNRYFGNRQWRSNPIRSSMLADGKGDLSVTAQHHRHSFGPSSDMLSPVVKVTLSNPDVLNGQSVDFAEQWKLGNWDHGGYEAKRRQQDIKLLQLSRTPTRANLPHYRDLVPLSPKRANSFSRTRSDPNLSESDRKKKSRFEVTMDEPGVHGGHYTVRPKMEENMTFLKKLFSHQREAGTTFPTLLIPPDSPVLLNQRYSSSDSRGSRSRAPGVSIEKRTLDEGKIRLAHLGVHTLSLPKEDLKNNELDEVHRLCLFNAKICGQQRDKQKENVWNVLADVVQNQMNDDDKIFGGWGGKGGGALGVDTIAHFFDYYEKLGDVQMLATMFCVLSGGHRNENNRNHSFLLLKGREAVYDTYIIRYAELLYSWGLLNVRAELNKHLKYPPAQNEYLFQSGEDEGKKKQTGLRIACLCPTCGTEIESKSSSYCKLCQDFAFRCSICDISVRGLFTFCEICHHGGHLNHMVEWFSTKRLCPTGCGCQCTLSTPLTPSVADIGINNQLTTISLR